VIIMLNEMFTAFDSKIDENGVYKVETIGDAYMVVAGHEELSEHDHAQRVLAFAKEMINRVRTMRLPNGKTGLEIRVGMFIAPPFPPPPPSLSPLSCSASF
jgi:class 3 adenylate cyclase